MDFLYKYRLLNQRSTEFVDNPTLYFANPTTFNDPFEIGADLVISARKDEVGDHFNEYLTVLNEEREFELKLALRQHRRYLEDPTFEKEQFYKRRRYRLSVFDEKIKFANELISKLDGMTDENAVKTLVEFYESIREQLKEAAICCLCRNGTSNPMWAKYADESRGILIEFYDDETLFKKNKKIERYAVNYSESGTINPIECGYKAAYRLFHTTKTDDWKHEQEERFFIFGNPRPVNIELKSISAIVLGERTISGEGLSGKNRDDHFTLLKKMLSSMVHKKISLKQSRKSNSMRFENKYIEVNDILKQM